MRRRQLVCCATLVAKRLDDHLLHTLHVVFSREDGSVVREKQVEHLLRHRPKLVRRRVVLEHALVAEGAGVIDDEREARPAPGMRSYVSLRT